MYSNNKYLYDAPLSTDEIPWSGTAFPLIKRSYTQNTFLDLAALLIPMTYVIEFNIIGRLFAIEVLLLALLPITLLMRGRLLARTLLYCCAI